MFRRRLRLSAAVTASLLIVAPAAISAVPAMAADEDPTVEVTIGSFLPVAPKPGQPVVIKGTVTNNSAVAFGESPQVVTCIDRHPLTTAAEIAAVPDEQNIPMNDRDSCSGIGVDNSDSTTYQVLGEKLAPNAKVPFTLTVPWGQWRISKQTGVYTVGVIFRGTPEGKSRVTAGRARTLMPVIGAEPLGNVSTALVIPLQHRPTYLGGQLFADDSLAQAMGPGGSLRRALDLGKQRRVTWLLDPALIDAAKEMTDADNYRIGTSYTHSVPGTNGKLAQTWLTDFTQSQADGNQVVALPYGDVDVAGLFDAGGSLKELVRQARRQSEQANLGVSARTNGLWLENGAAASRYLAFAAGGFQGANEASDLNLVNSAAWTTDAAKVLTPGTSVYQVLTPEGPAKQSRTVVADSALTAGGPDAGSDRDPLQVRQRFVAETALLAASVKGPATAVVVPPRGWDADGRSTAALAGALALPWLTPVTVDQVVKATPKPRAIVAPSAPKTNGKLAGPQLDKLKRLEKSINTYTSLLSDPETVSSNMPKGLLQSASLGWTGHADEAGQYAAVELGSVNGQLRKVHLVNSSLDKGNAIKVNLAGSNGTFPLTVANDLGHSIRVGVIVRSVNRTDLRVRAVDTVDVRAGQKWTPRINASAEQNGVIQATAQVVTVDGDPVGPPQPMLIQASQYGSVGWILVGAACALLFGTSFVRIYRRIRAERRNPPAADDAAADLSPENDPLHPAPLPAAPGTPATDADAGLPADASLKEGVGSKDG
ncbi:DUF6049 family protein [Kribbella albertanoniae]|uniref:Glycoprotein n=1 Tax=Kribbella albertanoniae TaxID=1266829 RepID=A0A4R4PXM1_9ACTN|nr:DUF6049 family protein [Kribbella albertanoniae]TDC27222.1 hypothetical protein E1261_21130 [Kribbella albertanoniae]